jgi:prepilin-type N-terminal cleavage/methylation domain-containing protein
MGKQKYFKDQKGFTLVEIAIVLVIIGLLIGGILKGQSMIQNAKVKRLVNDMQGLQTAIIAFQDRFGQLPGDENLAGIPAGDNANAPAATANNGHLDETVGWEIGDLRCAFLIAGAPGNIVLPSNTYGGTLSARWLALGTAPNTFNWIIATNIPAEACQEIDIKYDDGNPLLGAIRGDAAYAANTIIPNFGWRLN